MDILLTQEGYDDYYRQQRKTSEINWIGKLTSFSSTRTPFKYLLYHQLIIPNRYEEAALKDFSSYIKHLIKTGEDSNELKKQSKLLFKLIFYKN
ncbi:hypothetical protein CLOLEP_03506 [[Clostridium] leptum DSM 753]|jgi:hypothetical protein|uniref:Uncharacterized protein n=1 Tax=[Clostridium] leptum DSM 753 TaxID=428125 RepID=A7VY30_9FIRM|nr:hypothetical protein CLOLEP_03506 [[Clostridium] leptum DSM 753]